MQQNRVSAFVFGCVFTSGLISCRAADDSSSKLFIRGGSAVDESDSTAIRRSTVALTTDYVKPDKAGSPSLLEEGHSFCSGTIIGSRLIVTAAHCLQELKGRTEKGGPLLPQASDWKISFDTQVRADGRVIAAEKVIPHPDWNPAATLSPAPGSKPNDIGLIILSEDIPADMEAAAIAAPSVKVNGQEAALAGFGVTKDRNTNDTGALRTLISKFSAENGKIARVSHGAWFKGICAGDSGGPAYVKIDEKWQLVGAASTGAELPGLGCAGSNSNSTDIRYYKEWIARMVP